MTGLPWYKCYPRDFNEGMVGLTMEERGAYVSILNLIYAKGAPVDDDPIYFRMLLGSTPKAWERVRSALIAKRKLFEVSFNSAPCLMNRRAAEEIADADAKSGKFSDGGRKGGQKTQANLRKNNDIPEATLEPASSDTDTDTDTDSEEKNSEPKGSSPRVRVSGFEEFWDTYPRKKAKGDARKAYERAYRRLMRTGADPPTVLMEALKRSGIANAEQRFVPYPATWLNRESWTDEPDETSIRSPVDAKQSAREANLARALAGAEDAARRRA